MKKKKKNTWKSKRNIIVAAVLIALLAAGGFWLYYINATNYVATVDGEKILTYEYNFFLGSAKTDMEKNGKVNEGDEAAREAFWKTTIEGMDAKEYAKKKALDSAKEFKIQVIKAKENNIKLDKLDNEKVDSTLEGLKSGLAQQYGGNDAALKEFKKTYNIDFDKYKHILEDLMLVYKYVEKEREKFDATEAEMKEYYEENARAVDTVSARHILFATMDLNTGEDLPQEKKDEAKKKAEDTLAKVKAGEDMEKLALDLSEDKPAVDTNKGMYDIDIDSQFVQEFKDWALDHKVGDTAEIVQTSFGYHVMRVEKRTTFEEVKDKLKIGVQTKKYLEQLEKWTKEPQYDIKKNEDVLNKIVAVK